jgi:hypothetical protein
VTEAQGGRSMMLLKSPITSAFRFFQPLAFRSLPEQLVRQGQR